MPYSYVLANSLTGERLSDVTTVVANPDWATRAHSVGDAKVVLKLRDADSPLERPEWRTYTQHWARMLVTSWVDEAGVETAVCAHLIEKRSWNPRRGELTLTAKELTNELAWRMITGVSSYVPSGKLEVSAVSPGGLVRALVQAGLNRGDASFYWNYNIDLGAALPGSEARSYNHHELQAVSALIQQVRDSEGGPDYHLDVEWRSGVLWWVLRIGTPRLAGATFDWSQSADESPLRDAELLEDGSKMTTGTFVVGKGTGAEMRVGLGDPANASPPLEVFTPYRDRKISQKHVSDQAQLDSLGAADVAAHFYASTVKSFSVAITNEVTPATLRIGARINVTTDGDEFEEEGTYEGYLVGLSGSARPRLGLEVIPL